ncbi:MAG TPA: glycoside hydrolase family 95 protein [Nonomuraea sp.]|nr:glycoside hydrolase family 95 protein [Nonomuraea sp.]
MTGLPALWYDRPATDWETEALPIGNGALGAMVFGGTGVEQIQFNEKTLWTGGPGSRQGYHVGDRAGGPVAEVRERLDRAGRMAPEEVAALLGQPKSGFGAYQTFGDVWLDLPEGSAAGYRRELSLREAVARVAYTVDGVRHTREYFASHPGNVIVGRVGADRPGAVAFTLRMSSPHDGKRISVADGRLTMRGALADNGMVFEAQVRVVVEGGARTDGADRVTVTGADAAVFVLSAGTDYAPVHPMYRGEDPHEAVTAAVDAAVAQGYDRLRKAHQEDHARLFDRVELDLGQEVPVVPTDRLRAAYTGGGSAADRALEALYFDYGRYLLIASSRPGSLPANLQGVWNDSTAPAWAGDYHVNVNLQMNYWPAAVTNLAETARPYADFVLSLMAPGRRTAREMFGAGGWVVHNETNPFGFTGVHDWPTAFWFPEAAAWLARDLYEHFLFSRDAGYLRETAYPAMKGAAEFWLDLLRTDPRDGTLVVSPSYSPEHGDFSAGASMSQQIVLGLFTDVAEAAAVLDVDAGLRARVLAALERLDPGLRIGSWGQLQEWKDDWDDPQSTHRHVSHLYALHPGRQLAADDPEAAAARVTLAARGDGGTGWSRAWKINFWARLRDGDHAHTMLAELLKHSTLDNLWDTHPPFQIDGNFGAVAGMAEMLVQSHHGVIDVLPALPAAWPAGRVRGLRARGDVTVDVSWRDGSAERVTLRAGRAGPIRVRAPGPVYDEQGEEVAARRAGDTLAWDAAEGAAYTLAYPVACPVACGQSPADLGSA